jgi:hypothetical protein
MYQDNPDDGLRSPLAIVRGIAMGIGLGALVGLLGAAPRPDLPPPAVTLAWDDTRNVDHDGYAVQRREERRGSGSIVLASVDPTTRTYTDRAVLKRQRLCYVVVAYRNDGEMSAPSAEVCTRVR